jgi:hypothetical protein
VPHGTTARLGAAGTRLVTAKAVGIRRQAGRGADGRRAVDRFRRAVGVDRAAVAEEEAALPLPGSQASARSASAAGNPLRLAHGRRLAASARRARLRLGRDVLAPLERVAAGGGVGAAALALARAPAGGRGDRVGASDRRLSRRSRSPSTRPSGSGPTRGGPPVASATRRGTTTAAGSASTGTGSRSSTRVGS